MKWSVQERLADNWNSSWSLHLVPCCRKPPWLSSILQASVCMMKAEDAQALANSINLSIRDQQITASVAKVPCGKYMHVALVACPVETLLIHRKHEASTKKAQRGFILSVNTVDSRCEKGLLLIQKLFDWIFGPHVCSLIYTFSKHIICLFVYLFVCLFVCLETWSHLAVFWC